MEAGCIPGTVKTFGSTFPMEGCSCNLEGLALSLNDLTDFDDPSWTVSLSLWSGWAMGLEGITGGMSMGDGWERETGIEKKKLEKIIKILGVHMCDLISGSLIQFHWSTCLF